ncbi:MAG: hypothetical protein V2A63_00860 [Patescibacteria group bacterium]
MNSAKRENVVLVIEKYFEIFLPQLEKIKAVGKKGAENPIWLWHALLASFATQGNSRGYTGLIENPENLKAVDWSQIVFLSDEERIAVFEKVFSRAKMRMSKIKAERMNKNFHLVAKLGGARKATIHAFALKGANAKIQFLKQFSGIADKYSRNIWMDIYDLDFRNFIAIDERIKKISEKLGILDLPYEEHEKYYLEIANEIGISGWELDRLLYNCNKEIVAEVNKNKKGDPEAAFFE